MVAETDSEQANQGDELFALGHKVLRFLEMATVHVINGKGILVYCIAMSPGKERRDDCGS